MNAADTTPRTRSTALRHPQLTHRRAIELATTEYARFLDLLRDLAPEDWARPTECPGWDVRAMAGHTVGMAKMATGFRETLRQDRAARKRGGDPLDALTALQVEEHARLSTEALVERFSEIGPRAARGRSRMPALVRRAPMPGQQDVGGVTERWSIGFLNDVILTRDPWMHRMDICRATGRTPVLTPDHDAVLVADVVEEWAGRHDRPYRLLLDGPAGGAFARGDEVPELRMDAVAFCRVLSGRRADVPVDHELLDVAVPF
jgi:uncharacterized protein (TIGR03083 family)